MARIQCSEDNYPDFLLAVAGYGLAGAVRAFPAEPLGDESWASLLQSARTHRVTGLLLAAVDEGAFPATEIQVQQAHTVHLSAIMWVMSLEHELLNVVDLLAGSAIGCRVLKGAAVAHLDYARPELRSFIDLDVLVRAEDFDRAVQVLVAAGFVRRLAEPRPGFDRRFDKGTTLVGATRFELDLHRTFVLGPWGLLVDLDDLWKDSQKLVLGGRTVRALSRDNRLRHACYHAALGDWPLRLGSLRDIAEMILGDGGELTVRRMLGPHRGTEAVLAAAVADSWRLLGIATVTELSSWAQSYVPSRKDEARLALHTRADKTFAAQAVSTLGALPRLRDKASYIWALILPDAEYVADRHASAMARFRYGIREVRRGRSRSQ